MNILIDWRCPKCGLQLALKATEFPFVCVCRFVAQSPETSARARRQRKVHPALPHRPPPSPFGPGAALLTIVRELRIDGLGCGCAGLAQRMNAWGIAGCLEHRAQILGELNELAARARALESPPAWFDRDKPAESIFLRVMDQAPLRPATPFIRAAELFADTMALAAQLPTDLAAIVAWPRSGILPASILATHLHLPMFVLRGDALVELGHGWRLAAGPNDSAAHVGKDRPMLLVDDNQVTGRSLTSARKAVARHLADRKVLYAVIYRPVNLSQWRPDFVARELAPPLYLEWNLFNSLYTPSMACDFDGILCHDSMSGGPIGKPLYLPKRCELPLIITGRPEGSRGTTLAWLAQHGVKVRELKMWPAELPWRLDREVELGGHKVQHVSAIKAHHYRHSACSLYVESDPRQAREISVLSEKPVLCPAAGRVF